MAVFRVEKTRDYTVMANHHLKNKELTLKAKGLLSVMLSLPEDWDYTLKGLSHINREGVDAIREAVRELERAGYVQRSRNKNAKGQFADIEYVIYEQPRRPYADEEPASEKPMLENPILDNPTQEKPVQGNPALEKPALENPTQLNTDRTNTQPENIEKPIPYGANPYPSIPYPSIQADSNTWRNFYELREEVKINIGYEPMCQQYGRERIDELVSLILEVLCVRTSTFVISGKEYPIELVQAHFKNITSTHIQYACNQLNENASKIRNIKAYLLTTLFNLTSTCEHFYGAEYRHNRGI